MRSSRSDAQMIMAGVDLAVIVIATLTIGHARTTTDTTAATTRATMEGIGAVTASAMAQWTRIKITE